MKYSTSVLLVALCFFLPGTIISQIDLANGLIAYYSFNDGTASDQSGNDHHGMVNGMATVNGRLVIHENDSSRVNLPAEAFTGLNDLAICFAVEFDTFHTSGCVQTPTNTVMGASSVFEENELVIAYVANTSIFEVTIDGQKYSVQNVQLETHHQYCIVITRENSMTRLYIDGVEMGQGGLQTSTTFVQDKNLVLGQEQDCIGGCFLTCQSLSGNLDEVRFYNRALSEAEVGAYCQVVYTSTEPTGNNGSASVIPNPATSMAWLDLGSWKMKPVQVDILDLTGRVVATYNLTNQENAQLDLSGLPAGMYTVRLSSGKDHQSLRLIHLD